jgi:aminoglycoside 3-N-acetyltransferase
MLKYRELVRSFQSLQIPATQPVLVHASLSALGPVRGGAETVVQALLGAFPSLMAPTFTYKTMLTPQTGPAGNAMDYGTERGLNRMAEFFRPDMPADRLMGIIPETLRLRPDANRSTHPILSFAGVKVASLLAVQTLQNPFAPIRALHYRQGWVLLLGVDHTTNTSLHYAEHCAGRRQFLRWALTAEGVVECPGFPGCSEGFQAVTPHLEGCVRPIQVGNALVQAFPVTGLVDTVIRLIHQDAHALLCSRADCLRCAAVRQD